VKKANTTGLENTVKLPKDFSGGGLGCFVGKTVPTQDKKKKTGKGGGRWKSEVLCRKNWCCRS